MTSKPTGIDGSPDALPARSDVIAPAATAAVDDAYMHMLKITDGNEIAAAILVHAWAQMVDGEWPGHNAAARRWHKQRMNDERRR